MTYEQEFTPEQRETLKKRHEERNKNHCLLVVTRGTTNTGAYFQIVPGFCVQVVSLDHPPYIEELEGRVFTKVLLDAEITGLEFERRLPEISKLVDDSLELTRGDYEVLPKWGWGVWNVPVKDSE